MEFLGGADIHLDSLLGGLRSRADCAPRGKGRSDGSVQAVTASRLTWNDFQIALTLTCSRGAQTLPVGLSTFVMQCGIDWGPMSAAEVLMAIPTRIFVWFAMGLLVKGLVTDAVCN
jgi:ABC-type maltose transport system permease subunit